MMRQQKTIVTKTESLKIILMIKLPRTYITEVLLVHLDLFDVRSVIGCVDFVLLLVIILPIKTLWKCTFEKKKKALIAKLDTRN